MMGDVKRYATVVIKRLDDSWALADWVPDDDFIALEIKYDALRARLVEVERMVDVAATLTDDARTKLFEIVARRNPSTFDWVRPDAKDAAPIK